VSRFAITFLVLVGCKSGGHAPGGGGDDSEVNDTGTSSDADGDGYLPKSAGGNDCDDANASVHPGAYDRPNDGIDGDCDGADRTCDCLVLDGATSTMATQSSFDTSLFRSMDVAYVVDVADYGLPGIREAPIDAVRLGFQEVVDSLADHLTNASFGVASFDDYQISAYASANGKPFVLESQQTDDAAAIQSLLDSLTIQVGGDVPTSGMEALYQALTGTGYDQTCDEIFDAPKDVLPFFASETDPFRGAGGQAYDPTVPGTGTVGGMGFRENAHVRVVVYATDLDIRNPEAGDPGAGAGCPMTAGPSDVAAAAVVSGTWLVGLGAGQDEMEDLAISSGSFADIDSRPGVDPLVFDLEDYSETNLVLAALDAIRTETGLLDTYDEVSLVVRDDPFAIVEDVTPKTYTKVAWRDVDSLAFDVTYDTTSYDGTHPIDAYVDFALMGDGFELAIVHVDVEIAPP
jgi:hypothetical protein